MKQHRKRSIPWFRKRLASGTVYLMQSDAQPDLFKVGFTARKTKTRRTELAGKVDGKLVIRYTVSMPHAWFVEQLVLKRLRSRLFGRGDSRGTEWFHLRRHETISDIAARMDQAAADIRLIARLKFSWPIQTKIKKFSSIEEDQA